LKSTEPILQVKKTAWGKRVQFQPENDTINSDNILWTCVYWCLNVTVAATLITTVGVSW